MSGEKVLRNNMKHMREQHGLSQKDVGEVISAPQHAISQFETGARGVSYETVQMLANFYRIPVEQFVKEDLTGVVFANKFVSVGDFYESFKVVFPFFKTERALEDMEFEKGYDFLNDILDGSKDMIDSKKNKYISLEQMEDCVESFVKAYNTSGIMEAVANALAVIMGLSAPAMDKETQDISEAICKEGKVTVRALRKKFLRKEVANDPNKEEFIEDNEELVMDAISILKASSMWSELGDYYLAMKYIVGLVDNEHNDDMNQLIGMELMYALTQMKNKYALAYWKKIGEFFMEEK